MTLSSTGLGSPEDFKLWLELKGLSDRSIQEYMRYYWDFINQGFQFRQSHVDHFLHHYNNSPARSALMHIRSYIMKRHPDKGMRAHAREIEIEKVTGRKKRVLPKILTKCDVDRLERYADDERTRLMIRHTFDCGIRAGGLLNIKEDDYDWQNYTPGQPVELRVREKGDKERIVFVPYKLFYRVSKYLERKKDIGKHQNIWGVKKTRWAVLLNKAAIGAFGRNVNPHLLRHSFATHMINNGGRIEEVKELLGHENIATTQIYAHLDKQNLKDKYSQIMNS